MWAQVRRALAGLVAVLQEDRGSSLIRSPPTFIVEPLPVNATAEARGLGEQGPAYRPGLSWKQKEDVPLNTRHLNHIIKASC